MTDYPSNDSKDTWHVHEDETWNWGINCDDCYAGRGFELQRAPMVGTIPGGHNDVHGSAQYKFQRDFDPGLEAYEKARGEGLSPKATTVKAVEEAHAEVKSHERGVKKLRDMGVEEPLPVAAGVDA